MAKIINNHGLTQQYAFTVTLSKKMHHQYTNHDQLSITSDSLKRMLENITDSKNYCLIAELTQAHDIHYHGIIRFRLNRFTCPINAFYNNFKNNSNKFGFVNIKPIDDYNGWKEYLCKELNSFKFKLNKRPIIHNGDGTFSNFEYQAC